MSLHEVKPVINQELVEMLELLIERARSGDIVGAAVATVHSDASTGNCFSMLDRPITMIGELAILQRDIIDCNVDTRFHSSGMSY
jgi:hypothetical protein